MSRFYLHQKLIPGLMLLAFTLVPDYLQAQDLPPIVQFTVSSFKVSGENPLGTERTEEILSTFVGPHEGLEGLLEAAAELESEILAAGFSFHRVVLPPQTLEAGEIKLEVVVFKLANIDVTGNEKFSDENIIASLPGLKTGTVPDTRELARELIIANNHPSKQVTIRLKHSKTPDSVDAELAVKDQRPWQFFSALNNIGTDETGEFRLTGGFQHTNLLDLDDTLTISYTTSPGHFSDVKQYGANYRLPLYPLSGALSFYYSRSDVDSGTIEQVFDVSGAGKFIGGSFTYTFRNRDNYRHRASLGVDDKIFENNINFQGIPLGVDVRSRPLSLSYSGEWRFERAGVNFQVNYLRNLPGGSSSDSQTYAAARSGASKTWEALRFSAAASYAFAEGWSLSGIMTGQYTDEPLISGEQFGIGGYASIRGFEERGVTGDRGLRVSLEALSPPVIDNLRLLAFVDSGFIKTVEAGPGEVGSDTLVSLGVSMRWRFREKLSVNFDYGHEVNDARVSRAGGVKAHLNMFYRF